MDRDLTVAAVQMNSGEDKPANLAAAERLVREAAAQGAELIVLPELFNCLGRPAEIVAQAETIPGPTSAQLSAWAAELQVILCGGSICEQSPDPRRGYNTSLLFGPDGKLLGRYRKVHLFEVDLPGRVTQSESSFLLAGDDLLCLSAGGAQVGLAICYDLRFPELFRSLADRAAELLLVPAAFTRATGQDHWQLLLAARAVENQAFVVAANQAGQHTPNLASYGHSAVIDPWGCVLAAAVDEPEQVVLARLQRERLRQVRTQLPALRNRRWRDNP